MNLEFDDKTYVCRVVNSYDGEELIIGSTALLDALQPRPIHSLQYYIYKYV